MRHLPQREVREKVEILRAASFRRREDTCTVPEMALYVLTNLWTAVREARQWRPDIVHAHFAVPTGPVALVASLVTGIPYVLTVHLGDVPGGVPEQTDHLFRLIGPLVSPVWHRAKVVTAVSRFVAGLASKAYGVEPVVVPNGVRLVAASTVPIHSRTQEEFLHTLDALCTDDRVTVHGWLSEAHVAARMAASDILLLTSLQEGSPMVAIEALQWGLAIVSSRIAGMHDIVEEGKNGFLCDLAAASFAERLRELLATPTLLNAMRRASREKAVQFDIEKTVSTYESILEANRLKRGGRSGP